jgi:hypothetical protein
MNALNPLHPPCLLLCAFQVDESLFEQAPAPAPDAGLAAPAPMSITDPLAAAGSGPAAKPAASGSRFAYDTLTAVPVCVPS